MLAISQLLPLPQRSMTYVNVLKFYGEAISGTISTIWIIEKSKKTKTKIAFEYLRWSAPIRRTTSIERSLAAICTFRLTLYQLQSPQMWYTDGWYQKGLICNVFLDHYHKVWKRKTRFAFFIEKQATWLAWSPLFIVKTDNFHGKVVSWGRSVHFE